jgi:hypothetical protein
LQQWDDDTGPEPEVEDRYLRLHVETAIALQIVLATGEFRAGHYTRASKRPPLWTRD